MWLTAKQYRQLKSEIAKERLRGDRYKNNYHSLKSYYRSKINKGLKEIDLITERLTK